MKGIIGMFNKKILLPHQYYYPHMDLVEDKSTIRKEEEFFKSLEIAKKKKRASVYIHIPFCDSRCEFCGFDKVKNTSEMEKYKDIAIEEIKYYANKNYIQNLEIDVIHIGGGTPTILPPKIFNEILGAAKKYFNTTDNLVINIEGSATTIYKDEVIEYIKENNISKVSVGVQTFNSKLREKYKSKATLDEVYLTLNKLKDNKIKTGIDIMYGFPDFRIGNIAEITFNDINEAIKLDIDAIDFGQLYPYCNNLEKRIKNERLKLPNKHQIINVIKTVNNIMKKNGYEQKASYGYTKKNSDIMVMESSYYGGIKDVPDCIAIGSGAFGFINGYKYRNNSYNAYLINKKMKFSQLKKLNDIQLQNLNVVGFPKVLYLSKKQLTMNGAERYDYKIKKLLENGMLEESLDGFSITEEGKCFIDNIYYYLLEDEEKERVTRQTKILYI
ncbi:radical SAM protein [Peptoniphilus rhinitidis]|uniref:radical SAM protein n=2 Tax=Peptoniphilaceae TaxID=1570339 RepID=UPI0002882D49|nr:radical SAM protein [Peptoniphilus rhinitidis]